MNNNYITLPEARQSLANSSKTEMNETPIYDPHLELAFSYLYHCKLNNEKDTESLRVILNFLNLKYKRQSANKIQSRHLDLMNCINSICARLKVDSKMLLKIPFLKLKTIVCQKEGTFNLSFYYDFICVI